MKNRFLKTVGILVTIYAFLGFLVLPYYLQHNLPRIIEKNFQIKTYLDRIDLNPFTFEMAIDGFILQDKNNKDLLFFETLYVDLELLDLLQNKIHLKHLKLDNFRIDVDLDKNKTPNFQFLLEISKSKEKETKETKSTSMPSLQIDKLDLTYLNLLFTDNSKKESYTLVSTPFDINLENISIDPNHTNNVKFKIDTKESGRLEIESKVVVEPFKATGNIKLSKVNINKKFNYFKPDDIEYDLESEPLHLGFDYSFEIMKDNMALKLSNIALDIQRIDLLKENYGVKLNKLNTKVKSVDLTIAKDITYKVNEIAVGLESIDFNDKNINNRLKLKELNVTVKQVTSKKEDAVNFITSVKMPSKGFLKVNGNLIQEPLQIASEIKLQNTTLKPYEKYIQQFVNLGIDSFFVNLDSAFKYSMKDDTSDISLKANGSFNNISLINTKQKQKITDIKQIDIKNLEYKDEFLKVENILFKKPFINVNINKNKTTNFSHLVKKQKSSDKQESKEKSKFGFMIKKLTIQDGNADILDDTITPSFNTKEEAINIIVDNLSLNAKQKTKILHKAVIDKYATMDAKGSLKLEDPLEDLIVSLQVKNIDLPSLSSYSGKFIGSKLENGKLSLNLNHTIKGGQLNSTNNIRIKDIELGEKIESKDAIDAPIGLAIALLEDSSGMIDLDIPMSGDVKSPKFDISDAISDVIVNTIVGIVSAPFKFLALLAGLDGDQDISNTGFAYGDNLIDPTQKEKLDTIAKALIKRPQLVIKITPAYSLEDDKKALVEHKFKTTYPLLSDTSKKLQELYDHIKEQFIKIYTEKEYDKLKEKEEDKKYPYMVQKLKETIVVELQEIEALATSRAKAVEDYFIANGVDKNRIYLQKSYATDNVDKKLNQVIVLFELDTK